MARREAQGARGLLRASRRSLRGPRSSRRRAAPAAYRFRRGARLDAARGRAHPGRRLRYGLFSTEAVARGGDVVSIDIGERLVRRAAARAGSRGLVADARHLALRDASFDVVIASEMLEHTDDADRVVAELARVVKPGGLLVLTTPNRVWQRRRARGEPTRLPAVPRPGELRRLAGSRTRVRRRRSGDPRASRLSSVAVPARAAESRPLGRTPLRRRPGRQVDGEPVARGAKARRRLRRGIPRDGARIEPLR